MAQIIVRPIADISQSSVSFSSGSYGYTLINEVTADGDSTYVRYASYGATLTVRVATPDTSKIKTINSVTVYITSRDNGYSDSMSFGFNYPSSGGTSFTSSTGGIYSTRSYTMTVNQTPANFNLADLRIYYTMSLWSNTKSINFLTQMYVVIDYVEKTVTAYIKIDGTWKAASAVYIKIDGVWKAVISIYDKISDVWRTG